MYYKSVSDTPIRFLLYDWLLANIIKYNHYNITAILAEAVTGSGYTYITAGLNILRINARTKEYLLQRYSRNIPIPLEELEKIA